MTLTIRRITLEDVDAAGEINYTAFKSITERHGFTYVGTVDAAVARFIGLTQKDGCYGIVAEVDGQIVGSNFLDESGTIGGIGPITVSTNIQGGAIGRQLMTNVLERTDEQGLAGVRLVQAAYNGASLSLYAKLGFVVREPLSAMSGEPPRLEMPGRTVRQAVESDWEQCNNICRLVHGHDRAAELLGAIRRETALLVEHDGSVTGYATEVAMRGHAVARTNDDLKALICAPATFGGSILVPSRNAELFSWCLENGLRVVTPQTLMSIGLYNEPAGAFLPSIIY